MHIAKYTASAVGHMTAHYDRGAGSRIPFPDKSNIDPARSYLNYNLAPDQNQVEFIQDRLAQIYHLQRKDVNVMCTWVVTAPKDLPLDKEDAFFHAAYRYLAHLYDTRNIISAYVHYDEPTARPHLHFAFVPVVQLSEPKKGYDEALNAKQLINRSHLKQMHPAMQAYLEHELGIPVNLITGTTTENLEAGEYRNLQKKKELDRYAEANAQREAQLDEKAKELHPKEKVNLFNLSQIASEHAIMTRKLKQQESSLVQAERNLGTLKDQLEAERDAHQCTKDKLEHELTWTNRLIGCNDHETDDNLRQSYYESVQRHLTEYKSLKKFVVNVLEHLEKHYHQIYMDLIDRHILLDQIQSLYEKEMKRKHRDREQDRRRQPDDQR